MIFMTNNNQLEYSTLRNVGSFPWLMQRVTALMLLVLLTLHFWVTHYANPNEILDFSVVKIRLQAFLFLVVDFLLLSAALYHGINGMRNIALDFEGGRKMHKYITVLSVVLFIIFMALGTYALWMFAILKS